MQLDGIVPQIMSLPPHMLEEKPSDPATGKSWSYPPTYFMHMALDHATAQRVSADIAVIKSKQVGCMQRPMGLHCTTVSDMSCTYTSSKTSTKQVLAASAPSPGDPENQWREAVKGLHVHISWPQCICGQGTDNMVQVSSHR